MAWDIGLPTGANTIPIYQPSPIQCWMVEQGRLRARNSCLSWYMLFAFMKRKKNSLGRMTRQHPARAYST